jgi:hypothetical protein
MDSNEQINEALKAVRDGRLSQKSEEDLRLMLPVLHRFQASQHAPLATQAINAIENEIARRQRDKLHQEALGQSNRLHQEMVGEHGKLKESVDELKKPHWTLTPSFLVILLTMIFAAIAAWPVIREWIQVSEPANKAASPLPQQSNSAPAVTGHFKTSQSGSNQNRPL